MTTLHNPRGEVAQLYHPDIRDALVQAAARGDHQAIDQLAVLGLVRLRSDGSRFKSKSAESSHAH